MWIHIGQSEQSEWLQKTARLRLLQLDALDQIDELRRRSLEFTKRTGQVARSWQQLIAAGLLNGVPADPTGTPYRIDPATGTFGVMPESPLWPLPTEPAAAPEMRNMPSSSGP
jgi:hypothetical protein